MGRLLGGVVRAGVMRRPGREWSIYTTSQFERWRGCSIVSYPWRLMRTPRCGSSPGRGIIPTSSRTRGIGAVAFSTGRSRSTSRARAAHSTRPRITQDTRARFSSSASSCHKNYDPKTGLRARAHSRLYVYVSCVPVLGQMSTRLHVLFIMVMPFEGPYLNGLAPGPPSFESYGVPFASWTVFSLETSVPATTYCTVTLYKCVHMDVGSQTCVTISGIGNKKCSGGLVH